MKQYPSDGTVLPALWLVGLLMVILFSPAAVDATGYCEVGGGCDEYICRVRLVEIDNVSTCEGYGDFTAVETLLEYDSSYLLTVDICAAYSQDSVRAWIDWNGNYDFDAMSEAIIVSNGGSGSIYKGTVVVPPDAAPGLSRLRVRLCFNQTPYPCGVTTYGELEDYAVVIGYDDTNCGEANGDAVVNVADVVYIINYAFKGGRAPDPNCLADANGDDMINSGDGVYILNYIFKDGSAPQRPCCP